MSQDNTRPDVTIMMPCLNEELTLPTCIKWAQEALADLAKDGMTGEVLISDNGSDDRSIEIAEAAGCRVVHCPVKGYGNALIYGGHAAHGKYIVMGDSDESYDFRESAPMIRKLRDEGYDLCMGNRFAGEIKPGAMPWKNQHIGNPALSGLLNMLFRSGLRDAHCGLRAFTKEAFLKMDLSSSGMEFASEIVVKAALLNMKRTEIPITLHVDGRDRPPHLDPLRDGWRHLKFLFMFSPLWLYFIPAGILMVLSVVLTTGLLTTERGEVWRVGPLWFGDHWMVIAGGLFTVGYITFFMGLTALTYSMREHCRTLSPTVAKLYSRITLENSLVVGVLFILASLGILAYVLVSWSGSDFEGLSRIREMVIATTLGVCGLQTIFGAFLMSIIANENQLPAPMIESIAEELSLDTADAGAHT